MSDDDWAYLADLYGDGIELFAGDIGRLEQKIHDFRPADTGQSEVDLQKHFIRLWLQLLDMEVRKA